MKKLRIASLFLLFLALLALFAVGGSPLPTHAQGGITLTFDFTLSDHGFTNAGTGEGAWTSGLGWHTETNCAGNEYRTVAIQKAFGTFTVTSITLYYTLTQGDVSYNSGDTNGILTYTGGTFHALSTVDYRSGMPGPSPLTWTGSQTDQNFFFQIISGITQGACTDPGGEAVISKIIITGTGLPTPTPTSTLGPAPTSESGGGGSFEGQCALLGDDSSLFMTLPGAWTLDPDTLGHGGSGTGLLLEIGQASIVLNLNKYHKYQIALRFHVEDSGSGDIFSWQLGSTTATTVSADATADEQTFTTDAMGQNYEPDNPTAADIYTFTLKELLHTEESGTLVIDLACIEDRTPDVQLVPQGGEDSPPGVCVSCDYNPTGNLLNDLMAVFAWLWCGLSQIWDCVLKPLLLGLWKTVIDILRWLNFVRMWAGLIWTNLGTWLGHAWTVGTAWLIGTINNLLVAAGNLVFAFFNSDLGAFLINAIGAILNNPLSALIANTAHAVSTAAGATVDIVRLGAYYIGLIFGAIVSIVGAIPEIFIALVNGYNASPTAIPVWAPTCNSANTFLYYPCLGSYILDNTLLDGPAYLMFILLLGLVAVNTVLWTVRQIQEALTK